MFRLLTTSLLAILCLHLPAAHGKPAQAEKADAIQIAKIPDIPPAKSEQFDQAFRRGVDFLLKTQNRDGSWGDHRVIVAKTEVVRYRLQPIQSDISGIDVVCSSSSLYFFV